MPKTYDSEFRRRVIDLLHAGRSVAAVATDLDLAEATVYRWKAQDLINRGERDGPSGSERGELAVPVDGSGSWRPNWSWYARLSRCSRRGCAQKTNTR